MHLRAAIISVCVVAVAAVAPASAELPFKVRAERPRIFVRADDWAGTSVLKLREAFKLAEYQQRGINATEEDGRKRWASLLWLANGEIEAGRQAIDRLVKQTINVTGSESPSYTGRPASNMAAAYDWLRNHPEFTAEKRATVVAELERLGEYFHNYCSRSSAPIYYARYPGAVLGLGAIGLALHGDSPKAEKFIELAHSFIKEYGRARQYEDGSGGGGNYSLHHAFPDLARLVVAFESATDAGLAEFIREQQGDWLRRQLYFQIWFTMPNGYFVKEGDMWRVRDDAQHRMNIDILTNLLDDGFGRTHADAMFKRYGTRDALAGNLFDFFLFNDPQVKPRPLDGLGRAELFGRESRGYAFFRSGWTENDTVIFFRGGEGMDTHGSRGVGGFDIWRRRALAQRTGPWYDRRLRGGNARDCNTMIFTAEGVDGEHPDTRIKTDMKMDFDAFLKFKKSRNIENGDIVDWEVTDRFARVKADLTGASRLTKKWTRELVFLGYRHLIVRDEVETVDGRNVAQQWRLHLSGQAGLDGQLATTTLGGSRLFCKTLLPADARVTSEKSSDSELLILVSPKSDGERRTSYLHVLCPTDEAVEKMPPTSFTTVGGKMTVTVGEFEYTFKE